MPFVWDNLLAYVYHTFFSCELCLYGHEQRKTTPFPFLNVLSENISESEWYILDSMVCSWSCKGQHCENALNMILITGRLKIILLFLLFVLGFLKQNSPELVNSDVSFPWCSNSVKSWPAQIAACESQYGLYIFLFSPTHHSPFPNSLKCFL